MNARNKAVIIESGIRERNSWSGRASSSPAKCRSGPSSESFRGMAESRDASHPSQPSLHDRGPIGPAQKCSRKGSSGEDFSPRRNRPSQLSGGRRRAFRPRPQEGTYQETGASLRHLSALPVKSRPGDRLALRNRAASPSRRTRDARHSHDPSPMPPLRPGGATVERSSLRRQRRLLNRSRKRQSPTYS